MSRDEILDALLDDEVLEWHCTVVHHGARNPDAILRDDLAEFITAALNKAQGKRWK